MGRYLVHVNVLVQGRWRAMRFTLEAASPIDACARAEYEAMREVEGIEDAIADRSLRLHEILRVA